MKSVLGNIDIPEVFNIIYIIATVIGKASENPSNAVSCLIK
jgi:hypothetical protein